MKINYIPYQDPEVKKVDRLEKLMDGLGITIAIVMILVLAAAAIRIAGQVFWGW